MFPSRGTLGQPSKRRQQDEVLDCHQHGTQYSRKARRQSQVGFPETTEARPPQMTPVLLGLNPDELRKCVVHVKGFVVQNFLKYGARRRIVLHYIAVNGKAWQLPSPIDEGRPAYRCPIRRQPADHQDRGHLG